jgi:hypothetical protein
MNGHAQVNVLVAHASRAKMSGEVVSIQQPNQVDVVVNRVKFTTMEITKEGWQPLGPLTIELKSGENVIEFISHNPPIRIPSDDRQLAVAVGNLHVTTDDGIKVCE